MPQVGHAAAVGRAGGHPVGLVRHAVGQGMAVLGNEGERREFHPAIMPCLSRYASVGNVASAATSSPWRATPIFS